MGTKEFATIYNKIKLADNEYLLVPQNVIEGYSVGETFYSVETYHTPSLENIEESEYVVDNIITLDDILSRYDYEDLEEDFMLEYYTAEERDKLIVVEVKGKEMKKKTLTISTLKQEDLVHSFEMSQQGPCVFLNEALINKILSRESLPEMRSELSRYKNLLKKFQDQFETYGTTRIVIKNGKIVDMEDNGEIKLIPNTETKKETVPEEFARQDYSRKGLLDYLKQRIFGHDQELETIATVVSRNLRPNSIRQDIETILLVGPTGSGKTATFEAIGEYYNVPFRTINTPALVPEGIVGKSVDDYIQSIIAERNGNIARAQKSILLFDEFDKISTNGLDVKRGVIDELYKFMEGSRISIKSGSNYLSAKTIEFDTGLTTRIYSGVFEDAYEKKSNMGFGSNPVGEVVFDLETLYKNTAFNKELLDRIQYKLVYEDLCREDKKKALLSKIGILCKKRDMLKRLYGVDLEITDDFIEAFLDSLTKQDKSMRDVNNLISKMIIVPEGIIADEEGKYKRLILTRDTVDNPQSFDLC